MTDEATRPIVYIDANPFIYAIEGNDELASPIKELFAALKQRPSLGVTSELTLAEVLPKTSLSDRRRRYLDLLIWSRIFDLRPVTREVLVETADYRRITMAKLPDGREVMPKIPDAIHVVTAIRSGCRIMLSADGRMKLPDGMRLVEPGPAGISIILSELV